MRELPSFGMLVVSAWVAACASSSRTDVDAPRVDHHQHLFSPAVSELTKAGSLNADQLVALLDSAKIEKAVVLSMAYTWGSASRPPVPNEYERARQENDWTAEQVARHPKRLIGFCSVNPRRDYALAEIARCATNPRINNGLKLHVGNSDVDLANPDNVEQLRKVFAEANRRGMPIVVHMRTSHSMERAYGAAQAQVFLERVLPAAPDVVVQIAHLAGSGGYNAQNDSALVVFTDAIARGDARMKRVWFDVTTSARPDQDEATRALLARRIREIGVDRVLYGSDAAVGGNLAPREGWAVFRKLPLSEVEFRRIANNRASYLRN
jgi:predicted TIM-barrel fold metal-dependent hydrolase